MRELLRRRGWTGRRWEGAGRRRSARVPVATLLALGLLVCSTAAWALGFGRNKVQYDNFDWKVLNTPHFEIFFYDGEENLAARAAVIAEDAYLRLSRVLEQEIHKKIPFILYASPNDFQQTNIADGLIGEGTGGFSEPLRNRMVLPYPGDNAAFVHVINHELVHVFMFDVAYKSMADGAARRALFPIELWFAEGSAEYFSTDNGLDKNTDMWMRDATIYDWIVPLDRLYGGYEVYRQGQSAMYYLAQTYGLKKPVELFKAVGRVRNVSRALEMTIGLDTHEFSEDWQRWLRHTYWPAYQDLLEADEIGRRMTDHARDRYYFAQQPTLSPDGSHIAFFSDRQGFVKLFLMDVADASIVSTMATGYRNDRFLSFHSYNSGMSFSPEGDRLAMLAKSGGNETLYILRVPDGKILQHIDLPVDIASSPSWAPHSDRVVLVGSEDGVTDLLLVDLRDETVDRITDDLASESNPTWFPDGRRIVYSAYPNTVVDVGFRRTPDGRVQMTMVDFSSEANVTRQSVSRDIYELDLDTGATRKVLDTGGDDSNPIALDDGDLIFLSDASGISNLHRYQAATGQVRRFTNVLTGIFQPNYNREMDRLAFVAFTNAGYDIFVMENCAEVMDRHDYGSSPAAPPGESPLAEGGNDQGEADSSAGVGPEPRSESAEASVSPGSAAPTSPPTEVSSSSSTEVPTSPPEEAPVMTLDDLLGSGAPDSLATAPDDSNRIRLAEAEPESTTGEDKTVGTVEKYKPRFSLDPLGSGSAGGIYYTSGLGLGFANIISVSDLLGNHRMQFLVNFYGSIKDSDLAASYYYLKRRVNLGFGIFHYKNFFNSNFTTLGEVFDRSRLFTERNYGFFGIASRPFSTFNRLDFEVQAFVADRTFYELDPVSGFYVETSHTKAQLIQPSLSLVHDSAFFGPNGPLTGSRWTLNVSPAIPVGSNGLDRFTAFGDYRKYIHFYRGNAIAMRFMGAFSNGSDPNAFVIGGPFTLRGWDVYDFEKDVETDDPVYSNLVGRKMLLMNLEYRFPAFDAIFFGWPAHFGIGGIGGVAFFDTGSAFSGAFKPFGETPYGNFRLLDLKADYGLGVRVNFMGLPFKFDWAWKTDLAHTYGDMQFTFSIGSEF